jgi:putative transcriptional regulator
MDSLLKERLERLGPTRAVDRVLSGSPAVIVLRLPRGRALPKTIDAMTSLAKRGLSLLKAKRSVEEAVETGSAFVCLPTVENVLTLVSELVEAGFRAGIVEKRADDLDVRRLRERLGLTREQFALRYGMEVDTIRNWETGKRTPDTTAQSYLRAISNDPQQVEEAYAPTR